MLDFYATNCKVIHLCGFKPLHLWWCYGSRKLAPTWKLQRKNLEGVWEKRKYSRKWQQNGRKCILQSPFTVEHASQSIVGKPGRGRGVSRWSSSEPNGDDSRQKNRGCGFFQPESLTPSPGHNKCSMFAEWNCQEGAVVDTVGDDPGIQERECGEEEKRSCGIN